MTLFINSRLTWLRSFMNVATAIDPTLGPILLRPRRRVRLRLMKVSRLQPFPIAFANPTAVWAVDRPFPLFSRCRLYPSNSVSACAYFQYRQRQPCLISSSFKFIPSGSSAHSGRSFTPRHLCLNQWISRDSRPSRVPQTGSRDKSRDNTQGSDG